MTANTGFLLVNAFSFLQPYSLTLATPPEIQPYGWTTTDLWCAPAITGLYAMLTHAQPFWESAHAAVFGWLGALGSGAGAGEAEVKTVAAVDPEIARALCAAILAGLFATRTVRNFGFAPVPVRVEKKRKSKVQ